ncbi:hypothetical protein [Nonomuraea fuscirosea]|uniref:hypothetical protein n=1 Tax=Nonomuraea fuscirosea TaxID=1291556 RepID=UPI003417C602
MNSRHAGVTVHHTSCTSAGRVRRLSDVPEGEAKWSSRARVPAAAAFRVHVYDLGGEGIPTGTLNKNGSNGNPSPSPFDPVTGKFDARTTPLNSAEGFGRAWVKEWNRAFTLDGIGPAAS